MNSRASFDHLVGAGEQCGRHVDAERPRNCQIDREIELGHLLHGQVGRIRAFKDAADKVTGLRYAPVRLVP